MTRIRVWDLSLRIFHWVFAFTVVSALVFALTAEDNPIRFRAHMLAGLTAGFMLVIRIIVAVIGGKFSRISGFFFSPGETLGYLKGALTGTAKRYAGHNPGTANAALGMFVLVFFLVATGLTMSHGFKEEIHPIMAYILMGLIGAHLLGIVLHTLRYKEMISLSMVTGKKEGEEGTGLSTAGTPAGLLMLVVVALWYYGLSTSFDFSTGKLHIPLTGQTITLGGEEAAEGPEHEAEESEHGGVK